MDRQAYNSISMKKDDRKKQDIACSTRVGGMGDDDSIFKNKFLKSVEAGKRGIIFGQHFCVILRLGLKRNISVRIFAKIRVHFLTLRRYFTKLYYFIRHKSFSKKC
jgi:hypothetical protein